MKDESMHENKGENDGEDVDYEDADKESESSSSSAQESPCSTHHCPHSWAEWSELGDEEDGSLGELPTSQGSEGEGESEAGCPPALTPSLSCEQESSSESTEEATEETMPTAGSLLPTGSQAQSLST